MEEKVIKPITVERHEFIQNLTNLINNCNLPFFVIYEVLTNFCGDVKALSERELKADMEKYSAAVAARVNADTAHEGEWVT